MALTTANFTIGQKVTFGRTHGEKTLGEVIKVNRKTLKVRQIEARGTMRNYPVGTVWTVPPHLCGPALPCEPETSPAAPATSPQRSEADILRALHGCYCELSPENLSCDGELSRHQVSQRWNAINRRIRSLETELGRQVSEDEVWRFFQSLPRETWEQRMARTTGTP